MGPNQVRDKMRTRGPLGERMVANGTTSTYSVSMDGRASKHVIPGAASALLVLTTVLSSCIDSAPLPPRTERQPITEQVALSLAWIGSYDGWGTLTTNGMKHGVSELTLRITFDADSLKLDDCPNCVTVTLDPWFSHGNLPLKYGTEAFFLYREDGVTHTMAVNRFSGGGQTANALVVTVRQEVLDESGDSQTLMNAVLEFRAR